MRCRPRDSAASTSRTRGSAAATSASATGCQKRRKARQGAAVAKQPYGRCGSKTRLIGAPWRRGHKRESLRARTCGGGGGAAAAPALRASRASVSASHLPKRPPQTQCAARSAAAKQENPARCVARRTSRPRAAAARAGRRRARAGARRPRPRQRAGVPRGSAWWRRRARDPPPRQAAATAPPATRLQRQGSARQQQRVQTCAKHAAKRALGALQGDFAQRSRGQRAGAHRPRHGGANASGSDELCPISYVVRHKSASRHPPALLPSAVTCRARRRLRPASPPPPQRLPAPLARWPGRRRTLRRCLATRRSSWPTRRSARARSWQPSHRPQRSGA